jgi:hypothetical protein
MQVKNILQRATVELASSVALLRVALVGLDLERIREEEDGDAESPDLEEESGGSGGRGGQGGQGGRGGPRRAPSSPPRRWRTAGRTAGKTTGRLKFSKSKFEANFKCFTGIRVFL